MHKIWHGQTAGCHARRINKTPGASWKRGGKREVGERAKMLRRMKLGHAHEQRRMDRQRWCVRLSYAGEKRHKV